MLLKSALVLLPCVAIVLCHTNLNIQSKILGGQTAPTATIRYIVSIQYNLVHLSGGSIISNRWVLTDAGSSVGLNATDITFVTGTNVIGGSGGDRYNVLQLITHEDYTNGDLQSNIALIQSDIPIVLAILGLLGLYIGKPVEIIGLATADVADGTTAVTAGWGDTTGNGTFPSHLQKIDQETISNTDCQSFYENTNNTISSTKQLCTNATEGGGICAKDFGGPLVANLGILLPNNKLIGIATAPPMGQCGNGFPDVFTKVAAFRSWILEIAGV